jgi:hypothetical protein
MVRWVLDLLRRGERFPCLIFLYGCMRLVVLIMVVTVLRMIGQDMSVKKTQRKHSSFLTNSLGSLLLLLQRQIIIPHISTLQQ